MIAFATVGSAYVVGPTDGEERWVAFGVLAALGSLAKLRSISVGRNNSRNTALAFVVAGSLLLSPALILLLALAVHVPEWMRLRQTWYIQVFNIANYGVAGVASSAAAHAIGLDSGGRFALAGLAASVVFVTLTHAFLALMLKLARGHSLRDSDLFSPSTLVTLFVICGIGVGLAFFWTTNAWLVPTLVAPLAVAHHSFSTVAQLRESEERFRTMFESAATATILHDRHGRIVTANAAATELFGYDLAQLKGLGHQQLIHPDEGAPDDLGALLRGERDQYRVDRRLLNAAGEVIYAHVTVSLVRDADTHPQYALAMIEDVTEQLELEERLRQAQKLEAIGRLAGGVAHDFNNMLTAIGGYNALALERAPDGSALRSDLEEIRKATDRATLLTRQLLAFSRKQILQPELLNLNAVILELESMLRPLIGEDVVLTTSLDPALGPIEADPGQLQQVLMNLVVNARDAMPGGGTLSLETANVEVEEGDATIDPGRYVTLTVRDSGTGIDAETLKQIFEPFFTTKDVGKGTGLGLATVYGIVKQSGGYVVVESEPEVGTAFTVYLPRETEVRARVDAPPAPAAEPQPEPVSCTETVLLVEDEEVVRRLVRQVLEGSGYRVLEAADGHEAVALAGGERVDLLLTDLVMPKLGGRDVAAELRRTRPDLKVIFMSGYADGGILENGVLQPGTELLEKPFEFAELTARVRRVLDGA